MFGAEMEAALRRRLARGPSAPGLHVGGVPRAAVAIVLRQGDPGLEFLLIKRAEREGDPWSGQVALPGGHLVLQLERIRIKFLNHCWHFFLSF